MFAVRIDKDLRQQFTSSKILYAVWLCISLLTVQAQDHKNTCSVPPVEEFHDTVLTCHFLEDLSVSHKDFTVYHYVSNDDPEAVLDCWWLRGVVHCYIHPDFVYNNIVSRTLNITVRSVTTAHTGRYACQIANYEPRFLETCELNFKPAQTAEEQSSGMLAIVMIPTLLGVAVVVAAVILFLTYRRKCLSSSKKTEDPMESTSMLKTPIMEDEEKERQKVTADFQEYLERSVKDMYPDMTGTFYFVPPVYFNKTRYRKKQVAGEVTWVHDAPTDNDVRHDRAMQHVIHCLRHLAERGQDKMFVLTQFTFDVYLNNVGTEYVRHRLPTADSNNSVDLLIIHQTHGVLVGVVTAVSDDDVRGQDNQQKADEVIIQQIKEGLRQLNGAVYTMNHLMSDLKSVKVRKTLMLPRLSRSSLARAVASQPDQFGNCSEIKMSLCDDDLCDSNVPCGIISDQLDKLVQWWNKMNDKINDGHNLSETLYRRLISRFCGPATQPSLQTQDKEFLLPKTLAEAVSVTGDLYTRPMLSQDMVHLLMKERVFLVGPPNTGKTRLLTMVGKKWATSGHELHVFCGSALSRKSLELAFREDLTPTSVTKDKGKNISTKVNVQHLNFDGEKEMDEAFKNLIKMKRERNVYVIADDVDVEGKYFKTFCESLKRKYPHVLLWATSSKGKTWIDGWQVKTFTRPLNCPPAVVRECPQIEANYSLPKVKNTHHDNFYPTDGPPVKYIYHKKDGAIKSHNCKECGKEVAIFLQKHLITRNGKTSGKEDVLPGQSTTNITKITVDNRFSVLQDKDLLVLFEIGMEQGEKFIEGLRESCIAVDILRPKDDKDVSVEETGSACAMHVDLLCSYRPRRKIVVYVESSSQPSDVFLKWRAMTSCTSQLIIVRRNR